jgi:hypothetical protein
MGEQSTGHGGAIIEQFTQGTQALHERRITGIGNNQS